MTRVGKVLTILGVVGLVISVVGGVTLAVTGISKVSEQTGRAFEIHGTTTKHFDAHETLTLYAPGTQNASSEDALPQCDVRGPGVEKRNSRSTSAFTYHNTTVRSFASFYLTAAGDYTIDCADAYVVGGPPVAVGGLFSGIGGVLLAVFGGGVGLFVTIVGVIMWIVGRHRDRRAAALNSTADHTPPMPPAA